MKRKSANDDTHVGDKKAKSTASSAVNTTRSDDDSMSVSNDQQPTVAEIQRAITIPYLESTVRTTSTYQAQQNVELNIHMLNVLSNLNPLKHVPTVILSLIGEYCKRLHDTTFLRSKRFNRRLPARPCEQTILCVTSQKELKTQLRLWNDYFGYYVRSPWPEHVTFSDILRKYLKLNYTSQLAQLTRKCWLSS